MEWGKKCRGSRGGSCDVGELPVVGGIQCDLVPLEEERNLSLQIIAQNQEGSEGGSKFCVAKELLEGRFQGIRPIFRQNQLALRGQNTFPEDSRAILDIEVEKFTRT